MERALKIVGDENIQNKDGGSIVPKNWGRDLGGTGKGGDGEWWIVVEEELEVEHAMSMFVFDDVQNLISNTCEYMTM